MYDKFLKGSSVGKGVKKDHITIDVNPDQVDDIETLEDPMNKVKLNSVFSKTKKKMVYMQGEVEQREVESMIENLGEDLKNFNDLFKIKMKTLQKSIGDYSNERPGIPLLGLDDL